MAFSIDGYVHNGNRVSLSKTSTTANGKVVNTTPYSKGIVNVTIDGSTVDIQLSTNGSNWVDLSSATPESVDYFYLKIFCKNTTVTNWVNIYSIYVTLKGTETAQNTANYIMYEDTNNQCVSKLPTAITYLQNMSSSERTTFQTSSDYVISTARTRLDAWASSQGKSVDYSTGALVNANNVLSLIAGEDTTNFVFIVILTTISISSVTLCLIMKRRKMHQ